MAYKIGEKTTEKHKDCKLKEEDDIANIVNNTEIESFDIKQEWLDDISSKLDAYNSQKAATNYWWLLLLIPVITLIALLVPTSKNNLQVLTTNSIDKNELIENQSKTASTHKNKTFTSANQKSTEHLRAQEITRTTVPTTLKKLEVPTSQAPNNKMTSKKGLSGRAETEKVVAKKATNSSTLNSTSPSENTTVTEDPRNRQLGEKTANETKDETVSQSEHSQSLPTKTTQSNPTISESTQSNPSVNNTPEASQNLAKENNNSQSQENRNTPNQPIEAASTPFVDSSKTDDKMATSPPVFDSSKTEARPVDPKKEAIPDVETDENEDITIGSKRPKAKLWTVGFTLGPDLLEKQITANGDLLNFEQKKKEELFDNTWGFDFEVSRYLTPWLALGTGVGFKKYQEVNSYSSETFTTYDTSYTFVDNSAWVWDTIYNPTDTTWYIDTVYVIDTMTITNIKTQTEIDSSKKAANGTVTSSYVQIPITAQFIFINSKKLTAYTNLGLSIGLLTKNTGVMIDYDSDKIVNYTTKKMIYNANIGLGFNYNIIGPLDYKLYGAYQFNLTNFSLAPNVDKRFHGFSLRTGLVLHF